MAPSTRDPWEAMTVMSGSASAKRAFSIAEFCDRYGIRRTKTYDEIKAGRLRIVKVGRRSLITETDAEAWLAALPSLKSGS
jgi:excisionase family DNA binding protein